MKGLWWVGVVCVTLVLAAGCGDDQVSSPTPTPTPAPTPAPTPTPPPPAPVEPAALESIAVDPASVEGQGSPIATITLTAAAPAGGAAIALQSGNTDVAKVPSSVTVPAGARTATFTVDTSTVSSTAQVTLQATYLAVTKLVVLTVRSPALSAKFTVTSTSRGSGACSIVEGSGGTDCVFDATGSGGLIGAYIWTLKVGSSETTFTVGKDGVTYTPPTTCAAFQGGSLDSNGALTMTVTLVVEDRGGAKSGGQAATVPVYPQGRCGY